MRELLNIEHVIKAGIDTSQYLFSEGKWWLGARDAALLISYVNEEEVKIGYLINPTRRGELVPWKRHARWCLYELGQVLNVRVRTFGGQRLPDEKLKPSSLYQRQCLRKRAERGLL
jgi:hypothetical protein